MQFHVLNINEREYTTYQPILMLTVPRLTTDNYIFVCYATGKHFLTTSNLRSLLIAYAIFNHKLMSLTYVQLSRSMSFNAGACFLSCARRQLNCEGRYESNAALFFSHVTTIITKFSWTIHTSSAINYEAIFPQNLRHFQHSFANVV
jgi:hypothetical protein